MEAPRTELILPAVRSAICVLSTVAAVCCMSIWMALSAAAQAPDTDCKQTGPGNMRLECDVRFQIPKDVSSVVATVSGSETTLPPPVFERYPKAGDTSAFLFLVDTSNRARSGTISANGEDITRILRRAEAQDRFGLATLPGSGTGTEASLSVRAALGADPRNIERELSEMKANGQASPIYRSSIEGIRLLKSFPASRRALLLFSDGKSEDQSYTVADVIDEARKQNVAIYTFGIAERPADLPLLQPLIRLAEETGGRYFQADPANRHFAGPTLDSVLKHVDNGGKVAVDLSGMKSDQTVQLAFHTGENPPPTYRHLVQNLVPEKPAPPQQDTQPSWYEQLTGWIKDHQIASALAGIAILLLLLALIAWAYRAIRRRRQHEELTVTSLEEAETSQFRTSEMPAAGVSRIGSTTYATLQPLMNGDAIHPVNAEIVNIGRDPTNDIRLYDETISAHHATLVRKRDGNFELADLRSSNGSRVNGERVERRTLRDGDKIDLGRVQFRFVLSQAGRRAS